ncbi:PC4 and SFRS1-interacting protein-like [Dendronephthya gigantea]|uniref:PC4 and SFRS1-interacting protein-like n=1 Tax=Dendronephthya gigantea TaxID=151771 RepID=UPI001069390F|nr:PC4 and SFRS1-interacting protein-like [Dendronephthya gigantea]
MPKSVKYNVGDKIWAKMKGYPHWPARIDMVEDGTKIPNNKLPIFFYGTHETAFMQAKDLCPYEENKPKYYLPKKIKGFQEGLDEIEKMPLIKFGPGNKEKSNKKDDSKNVKKESKAEVKKEIKEESSPNKKPQKEKTTIKESNEDSGTETPPTKKQKVSKKEDAKEAESPRKRSRTKQNEENETETNKKESEDDIMTKEEFQRKRTERIERKKEMLKEKKRQEKLLQKKAEKLAAEQLTAEREKELLNKLPTNEQILERFLYDLKVSLRVESPDVARCIRIIGQIQNLDLTPEMIKNAPDLVLTLKRIRKYTGSEDVVERAGQLYRKLKSYFLVSSSANGSSPASDSPGFPG